MLRTNNKSFKQTGENMDQNLEYSRAHINVTETKSCRQASNLYFSCSFQIFPLSSKQSRKKVFLSFVIFELAGELITTKL